MRVAHQQQSIWTLVEIIGALLLEDHLGEGFNPSPTAEADIHPRKHMLGEGIDNAQHSKQHGTRLPLALTGRRDRNKSCALASNKELGKVGHYAPPDTGPEGEYRRLKEIVPLVGVH